MILAVIRRESGVADVLSGETLELVPEFLCVAVERKVEKKLGDALVNPLHEQACKGSKWLDSNSKKCSIYTYNVK